PNNHRPGIPLDMISYHFYAVPNQDEPPEAHQFTFFNQADRFLEIAGYIETLRKALSPKTGTMVNEIGTMLPEDWAQTKPDYVFKPIRPSYWNLSAAVYADVFVGLARLGIEDAGESGIPAAPGLWPSIAMLDWEAAQPNARFWVLKLIHDNLRPGDKVVETSSERRYVTTQAFVSPSGERTDLPVKKRARALDSGRAEAAGGGKPAGNGASGQKLVPNEQQQKCGTQNPARATTQAKRPFRVGQHNADNLEAVKRRTGACLPRGGVWQRPRELLHRSGADSW